jgi:hypothetical protein
MSHNIAVLAITDVSSPRRTHDNSLDHSGVMLLAPNETQMTQLQCAMMLSAMLHALLLLC